MILLNIVQLFESRAMIKTAAHQIAALAISFLLTASVALAQDSKSKAPERNGMLCGYMIMLGIYGIGKTCFAEKDQELSIVLDEFVVKFDAFILRNPDPRMKPGDLQKMPEAIAKFKKRHMNSWSRGHSAGTTKEDMCSNRENEAIKRYLRWREKANIEEIQNNVRKLLSVDRVPTMNPCL